MASDTPPHVEYRLALAGGLMCLAESLSFVYFLHGWVNATVITEDMDRHFVLLMGARVASICSPSYIMLITSRKVREQMLKDYGCAKLLAVGTGKAGTTTMAAQPTGRAASSKMGKSL